MRKKRINVISRKECGICNKMMPELKELSKEIPIKFIDADSIAGEKEFRKTKLPTISLPLINVDDKILIMGKHDSVRGKILKALLDEDISNGVPNRVWAQKTKIKEKEKCNIDLEFSLKSGDINVMRERCYRKIMK